MRGRSSCSRWLFSLGNQRKLHWLPPKLKILKKKKAKRFKNGSTLILGVLTVAGVTSCVVLENHHRFGNVSLLSPIYVSPMISLFQMIAAPLVTSSITATAYLQSQIQGRNLKKGSALVGFANSLGWVLFTLAIVLGWTTTACSVSISYSLHLNYQLFNL